MILYVIVSVEGMASHLIANEIKITYMNTFISGKTNISIELLNSNIVSAYLGVKYIRIQFSTYIL